MDSPNAVPEPTARTAPPDDANDADALPPGLESHAAKLVLLYVRTATEATAEEISSGVRMKQLALYPVLDTLSSRGPVQKQGATYRPAGAGRR